MAIRPSAIWQQQADEQTAAIAAGPLSPDQAYAFTLWPESLRVETDAARDELCWYIDASLEESGIDVAALEARHGIEPGELIGAWRHW